MGILNDNEARKIGRNYFELWQDERLKAEKKLDSDVKDFFADVKDLGKREKRSELYNELISGLKNGTYKKPSDFFKAKCRSLFNGVIYPRREADFYFIADHIGDWAYSKSLYRRSMRTGDIDIICENIMGALCSLYESDRIDADMCDIIEGKNLTDEQLDHKEYYYSYDEMNIVIAAEIDLGNERLIKLVSDIIMCESEIKPDHTVISAVTKCHNADLHQKLGKLLLAARLQEGLRQAICEKADMGTKEAFFALLDVMLENDLIRFSSVKRAVAAWIGLADEETVKLERISDKSVELIADCLRDESFREECLSSEDSMKIYIGLWSIGFYDAVKMLDRIREYSAHGTEHQLLVAGYMTQQLNNAKLMNSISKDVIKAHKDDPKVLAVYMPSFMYYCFSKIGRAVSRNSFDVFYRNDFDFSERKYVPLKAYFESAEEAQEYYSLLMEIYRGITKKSIEFSPCIFPWNKEALERSEVVLRLAYIASALHDNDKIDEAAALIPQLDGGARASVLILLLTQPETDVQRRLLTAEVCDKEDRTRTIALRAISEVKLAEENYLQLEDMLRYKNSDMRSGCIELLMKQNDDALFGTLGRLLSDKKEEKRTAALDMIMRISDDEKRRSIFEKCLPLVEKLENISAAEMILVKNILPDEKPDDKAEELYTDNDVYIPKINEAFVRKADEVFDRYFPKNASSETEGGRQDWRDALLKLEKLVEEHCNDEFTQSYYGTVTTLDSCSVFSTNEDGRSVIPFRKLWDKFYDDEIKSPEKLIRMMASFCCDSEEDSYAKGCNEITAELIGEPFTVGYGYFRFDTIYKICCYLYDKHCAKEDMVSIAVSVMAKLCKKDSLSVLFKTVTNTADGEKEREVRVPYISCHHAQLLLGGMKYSSLYEEKLFGDIFPLRYAFEHMDGFKTVHIYRDKRLSELGLYEAMDEESIIKAGYMGILTEAQMYRIIFTETNKMAAPTPLLKHTLEMISRIYSGIREIEEAVDIRESSWRRGGRLNTLRSFLDSDDPAHLNDEQKKLVEFAEKVYEKLIPTVLEKELSRGDTETEYSFAVGSIARIYGIDNFVKILCALGGIALERSYYSSTRTKKGSLSHLLAVCVPEKGDNAEKLRERLKGTGISEKRLIEAAMYSPEWLPIIGEYLGWEGFSSACYYFIAHMNESFDDKRKAVIAKYTPLTDEELNAGAFDISWFKSAYETLGQKHFDVIYDSAKYISDGSKHSRARKYADAVLGKMNAEETVKTIAEKRSKELLMAYALIPIKDEDDICARYLYFRQFLKESKKFGSQRSASEKKAVETAMQNLSINAGYADVTRLTLRMETKLIDDSRELFNDKEIDGTTFRLCVDDRGKTDIICTKDGKTLKSVPAKLKKNEYVVRLSDTKKKLNEQYRRTRAMFEQAMEDSTEFTVGELNILRNNPVVLPVIKDLLFVCGEKLGFLSGNGLTDHAGNTVKLSDSDNVIVAHPYALCKDGSWSAYQKLLFGKGIVQPFKQVFRELYVKTAEEAEMTHSLRYSGNQIQPAKTAACLKSRRWVADVEDGLQKVYYKENIVARIYAMADWFTPADIEAPTLEWVEFTDRKTGSAIAIKNIPDVIFSEVMRDVDMAVSVAHAGGIDPETSHSTVEMRAALIEFTLPLFKLTNVTLKGSHAFISGKYGEYTLHLGSGVIHKKGGAMINILPVHSQHRGKLFLPFADEDPKTAEIITKVLFLAEDSKIIDPSILEQIK